MKDDQNLLIDEHVWSAIDNPAAAESIARRLFVLKEIVDGEPGGAKEASEIIQANIEAAYLHTESHKAALRLYLLSLTGWLKPQDEPLQLINEAIKRAVVQIKGATEVGAGKKRRAKS